MDKKRIIQVDEKVPPAQLVPLSIQHVFAMFGASVLVPILFGIHSGIVLFMNGIGTLLPHQGQSSGLSRLQLCFFSARGHRHRGAGL